MANQIFSGPWIGSGKTEVRSLEVWVANDGSTVAVITEVRGETSLMNANGGGRLVRDIRSKFPTARVIEHWPEETSDFGPYREADESGGSAAIDPAPLRALGVLLP